MNASILASLIAAVIAGGIVWFFTDVFLNAAEEYREHFKERASSNLAAMFLFIEADKLFALNMIFIAIAFALVWLFTGLLILAAVVAIGLGASYPFVLRYLRNRRVNRAISQLPDALAAIASGMKSGQSLQQAMETVVTFEKGVIAQELTLFLRELRVGVSFNEALDNFYSHLPRIEVQLVAAAMKIARETGSNLAETLDRIASTLRAKMQMEGKIKALTSQGKLQGIVMAALPAFLAGAITLMEPKAMHYLYTTWYGWLVIGGVATMDMIGYFFIRKIVTIDV